MKKSKTYISDTVLSFNVQKAGANKHTHVSFTPLTLRGSMLTTTDQALQEAIERHQLYRSGTIQLASSIPVEEKSVIPHTLTSPEDAAASYGDTTFTGVVDDDSQPKTTTLTFSSVVEGKDYIAETYGVSRTKLRTRADIEKAGEAHGVKVEWEK